MTCALTSRLSRETKTRLGFLAVALVLGACGSNGDKSGGTTGGAASGGSSPTGGSTATGATGFDCTATAEAGDLVPVPAGEFSMGCDHAADAACPDDEQPLHSVTLSAFEIDRTEVTQAAYTACLMDGACEPPSCDWSCDNASFPASCVTWSQAAAYCAWAQKRLPTEAEWEKAARGTEGNRYPWGNDEPSCSLANMAGCGDHAVAVGSSSAGKSPYGALDMAGNVVELVADWYDAGYYATSPAADPPGPKTGKRYSGRGGGFKSGPDYLRSSKRDWYDPTDSAVSLGFRCAR
jgi:formylglycine-generating enzyme required for sulfatase activity